MKKLTIQYEELITQNEELKSRLNEAEEIINAIKNGEVDAVIIKKESGTELYTLKSADHTYRLFIEKMKDGALTLNKLGIIMYCNSAFANMVNMPLPSVIGSSFESLIPDKYKPLIKKLITRSLKEDCNGEIILPGNNHPLPVSLSLNTLEIDGGKSLSIIITDLSFQKETQEQKKAIEQKDEFISIASHELKTPVTTVKGYIQLLRFQFEGEGNEKAAEMLAKAERQVNKLARLVEDLLDVKKIETGQLQFSQETFDFNNLVREISEETARISRKHTISCQVADDCNVYGDRDKIGQVITNLISNAAKYSSANTTINIKTSIEGNKVRLSVQDFGMGIKSDQVNKIFDRFYRIQINNGNTYAGLGLGLYISSEIIKRHNGSIGVKSEYGVGSIFYFELGIEKNNV